ncbi:scaffolding protein [Lactobacillus pasteurii DSM 23907 = CRBIP 24.76]|uniref:Putative phage minor capsid protein n=1 Tax=Lactobacillus pasteurii DSM 23907 = CRBIP 24.76 TaxID=1423790 RepID=I7JY74_9LACO|nr:phage scaffolding protein [Lactobacillus pasteurii]KRK07257.1 scaffolding protein [Lactobacillus pasteurii DSM 23907 = CRBIP 24.76]TDG76611.1 hypothetical protein C5L33_001370 [Lactobacillus pasteurii]CCI85295.1 Putative phage minor capsid protein [Lactobacillus pasteurii DSM 23907 = CRBIP 24.76]
MEREFLEKQGLNADQIKSVMEQFGKDINSLKTANETKLNDLNGQLETYQQQISERDNQLKDLSKLTKDNEELSKKFEDAQKTITDNDKKFQSQLLQQRKSFAIEQALTKAGSYNNKALMPFVDMDRISTDDKGNFLHLDDVIADVREAFPQGFKSAEPKPEPKPVPKIVPTGNGSNDIETDPAKMSYEESVKLYNENPSRWRQLFSK